MSCYFINPSQTNLYLRVMNDMKEVLEAFGANLRAIRVMKGLTLEQLSTRASIPVETLQDVEAGRIDIDLLQLNDIAVGLGIEPKDLMIG